MRRPGHEAPQRSRRRRRDRTGPARSGRRPGAARRARPRRRSATSARASVPSSPTPKARHDGNGQRRPAERRRRRPGRGRTSAARAGRPAQRHPRSIRRRTLTAWATSTNAASGSHRGRACCCSITLAEVGGAQTYVASLLAGARRAGSTSTVAAHGAGPVARRGRGGRRALRSARERPAAGESVARPRAASLELVRLLRRERPDILHANSSKAGVLGPARRGARRRADPDLHRARLGVRRPLGRSPPAATARGRPADAAADDRDDLRLRARARSRARGTHVRPTTRRS